MTSNINNNNNVNNLVNQIIFPSDMELRKIKKKKKKSNYKKKKANIDKRGWIKFLLAVLVIILADTRTAMLAIAILMVAF